MARMGLFVGTFIAPLLFAQTTGSVEGRIVSSSTHAPIGGVAVTLRDLSPRSQTSYQAATDPSGIFRITDIAEATYIVEISKSGWRDSALIRKPVDVSRGETARLSVELDRLGVLRGRVVDGQRRPVVRARVELARLRGGSANVTNTDADGYFEISDSGTFTLMARPVSNQTPPERASSEEHAVWVPTYYPRAVRRADAVRIVLRPGEEFLGYEIRLRDAPVYRVRGVVLNENGTPVPNARVGLVAPDSWNGTWESQVASGPDGTFEFAEVWPRDWELEAQGKRGDMDLKGVISTLVSHDNVERAVIRVSPAFSVTGVLEGLRSENGSRGISVWLYAQHGDTRGAQPRADGTVRVDNLYPGPYVIAPHGDHPGYYLDSVLLGTREVTGQVVNLFDRVEPFRIVFKPNPGLIRGTAGNCRGCTVVLWGLDEPVLHSEYFRSTTSDDVGRFAFSDLRPGDYYACAFNSVGDPSLLPDLGFARALLNRATKINVDKGQTVDVVLSPLVWPE